MSDIALHFNNSVKEYDVSITNGDLSSCDNLETSVIISLFTWARADAEEVDTGSPRFGWWGDKIDEDNTDSTGSKLFLLKRCKITDETITKAEEYIQSSLKWLVDDGVASNIVVNLERNSADVNRVDGIVTIYRGNEINTLKFNDLWSML